MLGLLESFRPLWDRYKIEFILILSAFSVTLISSFIFIKSQRPQAEPIVLEPAKKPILSENNISVDIAGAVERPDVYEVSSGARLKDILILAGGLSLTADRQFFSRSFNLARLIKDQEKIYIPSLAEVEAGEIKITSQNQIYNQDQVFGTSSQNSTSSKINVNSASMSELDTLPGVGKVTAEKIIQNRPYGSIDELLNKKIVGKNVFEKIKDLIQI